MMEALVFGVQFIFPYDRGISHVFFPSLHILMRSLISYLRFRSLCSKCFNSSLVAVLLFVYFIF